MNVDPWRILFVRNMGLFMLNIHEVLIMCFLPGWT